MLSTILLLLKWIGIIIGCAAGIVLFLIALVLFVPIRYDIMAQYSSDGADIRIKATWLLNLARVSVQAAGEPKIRASILFFTLYPGKSGKKRRPAEKKAPAKKKESGRTVFDETVFETQNEAQHETIHVNEHETSAPETEALMADVTLETDASMEAVMPETGGMEKKPDTALRGLRKIPEKVRNALRRAAQAVRNLAEKLRHIVQKAVHAKQTAQEKADALISAVRDPDNRELIHFLWGRLKKLLHIIRPRKCSGYIRFGFKDPAATGQAAVYAAVLYGFAGTDIKIMPDFEHEVLSGRLALKGHAAVFSIILLLFGIYRNSLVQEKILKK